MRFLPGGGVPDALRCVVSDDRDRVAALLVALRAKQRGLAPVGGLKKFILLAAAAPVLWLAYNAIVYRNPLEFANGPYSARAIEQRSTATSHPGAPRPADRFQLLPEVGGTESRSRTLAETLAAAGPGGSNRRTGVETVPGPFVAAAPALDSPAVLLPLRRLQRCADLCAGVVAVFLLQRALRCGTASRVRGICGCGRVLRRATGAASRLQVWRSGRNLDLRSNQLRLDLDEPQPASAKPPSIPEAASQSSANLPTL